MKVFGQLEKAQLENLTADPTGSGLVAGRVWYRTDTKLFKVYDGAAVQSFVDLNTAQTLVNKILTTPQIDDAAIFEQIATPANPSSGYNKVYPKSDGKFYNLKPDGTEEELGSGGQGGINYIDNNDAESNTLGWVAYKDGVSTPYTGTGGSSTDIFSRSTSSPLRGVASFLYQKSTGSSQGQGVSYDFTIDSADKYKVLQGSFDYAIVSGPYADNDMTVWIYDITNAKLIQPAPYLIKNHSLPSERMPFEFQASDSTSYRLILHVATTNAVAYVLKLDNFSVGPQAKLYGSAITDEVDFTPTGSFTTNSTYTGKIAKIGNRAKIQVKIDFTGAPNATGLNINLPPGLAIDTSKLVSTIPDNLIFGMGTILDAGVKGYPLTVDYNNSTSSVRIVVPGTDEVKLYNSAIVTQAVPFTIGNGDSLSVTFEVPIQGWSSSQIMSHDASTRVVAMKATGIVPTTTGLNPIIFPTTSQDTHGCYNTATGKYLTKTPGYYNVSTAFLATPAANAILYVYIDGIQQIEHLGYHNATTTAAIGSGVYYANAGQLIDIRCSQNLTTLGTPGSSFVISMLQGPAQIAASHVVASAAYGASNAVTTSTSATLVFPSKIFDRTGSYDVSTGLFTCPSAGIYRLSVNISTNQIAHTANGYAILYALLNGADFIAIVIKNWETTAIVYAAFGGSTLVELNAGDTLGVRLTNQSGATLTLNGTSENWINIERIGGVN